MTYSIPYEEIYKRLYALTALDRADNMTVLRGEKPFVITPETLPAVAEALRGQAASLLMRLPGVKTCSLNDPITFETLFGTSEQAALVVELCIEALTQSTLAHIYRNAAPQTASDFAQTAEAATAKLQWLVQGGLPTVQPYDL